MKQIFFVMVAILAVAFSSCSGKEDEPVVTGHLSVEIEFTGSERPTEPVDLSEYAVVIIQNNGFGYTELWKNIEWPITAAVGRYAIAISSPVVSETDTEVKQYYGEILQVNITENSTTTVTVPMKLTSFKNN